MASAGYGKRTVAGQPAPSADDFALLPRREAAIAGFIDRLPDGADISVKALAKVMDYGQCALRTALNFLERAGHLLRRREFLVGTGGGRWVTRTWFSRAARSGDTWSAPADAGESGAEAASTSAASVAAPDQAPLADPAPAPALVPAHSTAPVAAPAPAPGTRAGRSRGYLVLASVGRRCPDLSLSAADCAALEPLVAEWFVRGSYEEDVLRALTDGLPAPVHHPAGLVRSRLTAKLPPEPADTPLVSDRVAPALVECGTCRAPGQPEAFVDGECGACRGGGMPVRPPAALPPDRVRALAAEARRAAARR
ncbi:hypothetical protein ACIQ7D_08940 [Streptomyces sp. NPDC096310]|uniref:hypothetical protein n=1 Tax=Streptomyces sp. NPDC096310 TaxID=3366082 RepID=UPI0037F8BF68